MIVKKLKPAHTDTYLAESEWPVCKCPYKVPIVLDGWLSFPSTLEEEEKGEGEEEEEEGGREEGGGKREKEEKDGGRKQGIIILDRNHENSFHPVFVISHTLLNVQ